MKEYYDELDIKVALLSHLNTQNEKTNFASELPFMDGKRRADLVTFDVEDKLIRGFEIKSDKDSFATLQSQVDDYLKVFDEVYLVTTQRMLDKSKVALDKVNVLLVSEQGVQLQGDYIKKSKMVNHSNKLDILTLNGLKRIIRENGLRPKARLKGEIKESIASALDESDLSSAVFGCLYSEFNELNEIFKRQISQQGSISSDDIAILEIRNKSIQL